MNKLFLKSLVVFIMGYSYSGLLHAHGDHSAPCLGPHKNDPVCAVTLAAPAGVSIYSAQVDWLNEKIIVKGENFSADTTVTIAGIAATIESWVANQLDIPMDSALAGIPKGNHNIIVDDIPSSSSASISLFSKASIIDKTLAGCPCEGNWSTALGGLWNPVTKTVDCTEISGGPGDPKDIAGTILSDPADPGVYPHYPIGAAFTADPSVSVCQLTEVDVTGPTSIIDLIKERINRQQQGECRTVLANNICNTINTVSP